jgi:oxygen-independent coproporphyrinogen III oxidase
MLGLYAHIPFCSAICNYCNFNRGLFDESLKGRFVEALVAEIGQGVRGEGPLSPRPFHADTLYFGGGTPSLLEPREVGAIVHASRVAFNLAGDAEITLEANPETVDPARLEGFRRAGINRLSFGVQSFRDEELRRLGRLHSARRAQDAVAAARAAGFDNVSIDLMMWLPGQDLGEWLASVEQAIAIGPDHLSLYILEVYPHLPLRQEIDARGWSQAPDDEAADMYETAMAWLDDAGYQQYEISNVARPGRQSRHNLKYWSDGEWLGFGPGAHSTLNGNRWRNVSGTDEYIRRMTAGTTVAVERRVLSNDEHLSDALFTGLRLNEGLELSTLSARFGTDIWGRYGDRLVPFKEAGLLLHEGGRLRLTRQGMLLANEVMAVFV